MGTKRVLDYCLASVRIQVVSSKAIDGLILRSDHRAVQTCFTLLPAVRPVPKRKKRRCTNWQEYDNVTKDSNWDQSNTLPDLEKELFDIASGCEKKVVNYGERPWDLNELKFLRAQRRSATCPEVRKKVSKAIWRLTRYQLRKHRTSEAEKKLIEFSNLEILQTAHLYPIKKKHTIGPNLEACAHLLKQVYTSDNTFEYSSSCNVPTFTTNELETALRKMRKGRCADKDGIVLEIFLHSGKHHLDLLLTYLNQVLLQGCVPVTWCDTFFSLLHKGGSTEDANNWRPIAILSITYKILARLVYQRIRSKLDSHQSEEQFGFRHGKSTTHALLILESMLSTNVLS